MPGSEATLPPHRPSAVHVPPNSFLSPDDHDRASSLAVTPSLSRQVPFGIPQEVQSITATYTMPLLARVDLSGSGPAGNVNLRR